MKCQGFWGLADSPPHKYIIEFKKEEVEELLLRVCPSCEKEAEVSWSFCRSCGEELPSSLPSLADFQKEVWDILVAEYNRHNKGVENEKR